jgi:hypothetical protein
MKNLVFHSISKKMPKHNQEIWYIRHNKFGSSHEFKYFKVEYSWDKCDEEGNSTGASWGYDEDIPPPPNCKLTCNLGGDVLWCAVDDVWKMLGYKGE